MICRSPELSISHLLAVFAIYMPNQAGLDEHSVSGNIKAERRPVGNKVIAARITIMQANKALAIYESINAKRQVVSGR